jgi:hypothetical protein
MNTISTITEHFGIKLSNNNKETLKKLINVILILLVIIFVYYFIISSYLTYDRFILPTLRGVAKVAEEATGE